MNWNNLDKSASSRMYETLLEHRAMKKLDPITELIDWDAIEKQLPAFEQQGSPTYPPLKMLKVLLLQTWYGLNDIEMEEHLGRNLLFRRFTGFGLDPKIPDDSTIRKFREQMQRTGLLEKVLDEINHQLERKELMLKGGKVTEEATVIKSVPSRPEENHKEEGSQDTEAD